MCSYKHCVERGIIIGTADKQYICYFKNCLTTFFRILMALVLLLSKNFELRQLLVSESRRVLQKQNGLSSVANFVFNIFLLFNYVLYIMKKTKSTIDYHGQPLDDLLNVLIYILLLQYRDFFLFSLPLSTIGNYCHGNEKTGKNIDSRILIL
ncbi:hypothetical protein BDC45DRAFT_562187 [Circinella umbellata]|nr:hypothetical protein BDC45DRAFT_562187 [Circinella umbellata]